MVPEHLLRRTHAGRLLTCAGCRYVVCDSFENPRKVYVWDLEADTAFVVGTFGEANWPSPETGRRGLHTHFTPDGQQHCMPCCAADPKAGCHHCYPLLQPEAEFHHFTLYFTQKQIVITVLWSLPAC